MGDSIPSHEAPDSATFERRLRALVARYRAECLWDLREDPDLEQDVVARMVLQRIASCADRSGFVEARRLLRWVRNQHTQRSAS